MKTTSTTKRILDWLKKNRNVKKPVINPFYMPPKGTELHDIMKAYYYKF